MRKIPLILASGVAILCILDSLTTLGVLGSGIGYEANMAIANFAYMPAFHVFKLIATLAILYFVHRLSGDEKLEIVSYASLLVFYSLIVANNVCVYVLKFDFGFTLEKMLILFLAIFATAYFTANLAYQY